MCVQYIGDVQYMGGGGGGVFSTLGNTMSTLGGHHEYIGVFSTSGDIMMHVGIS